MSTPCIVFDTETTGFPGDKGSFCAQIIEVGAVVVTEDERVVSPINFFVWQPASHLYHPTAQQAMRIHKIPEQTILSEGLPEDEAATRLVRWIERVQEKHGVQEVRAYNQSFDFWFLKRRPWSLFERTSLVEGEDIKKTAYGVMKKASGIKRAPSLDKAVDFLVERQYPIAWESDAHRAMEDARMAAWCAIFMEREALRSTSIQMF